MATLLARLADAASRRRRLVIGAWLAILLGASWFSLHQSDRLSGGGWDVPGSSSVRVADELEAFPSFNSPALSILVTGRSRAVVADRLAALFVIDVNAVRSMAIGAIVVVTISVLATVTLLPALLALVGAGVERLRARLPWRTGESGDPVFWRRWTETVMAHPLRALALTVPPLILVAAPLLDIRTYNRGLEQLPRSAEVRAATEQAQRLAGPGFAGPVHVLVDGRAQAARVALRLRRVDGVARVAPPLARPDGRRFLVDAYLTSDPESAGAYETLGRIDRAVPDATIGGATQFGADVNHAIFGGLPKMLAFILAVSYLVLLVLLRSVLLPLKAIAMNLLSVGAAYGVLVAIFQWGWLDWTGYSSPGHIDTIVPALVLAVTFGLSMDYEVFLLTRIRERYAEHGRNDEAVAEGLVRSARIITSAALVMVAVFAAFAVAGAPSLRELGVGL